ncbi:MAG: YD repeat [Geobacteraceae bacterium]|nr:MAG: YD repeat [Geobacteraceae bacterium]
MHGNGLGGSITYDNQYRIAGITAGTVVSLAYTEDANSNITAITNNLDSTKNKSYTYDALDRLATATATGLWGALGWTYDGVGNRQTQTNVGTNTYAYQTGTNKLTGITGAESYSFTFDANGNTATENARQYTYNQNQRLIQIVDGAVTAGYTYNGNGQRAKKAVNGQATIFHYSTNGQIIAESNSTGTITAEYVYLNSQPLAKIEGTNTYYYLNDHLGTPQKMTDGTGAVVWSAEYKPFGEATIDPSSTITNNLRFPGQYYDSESGLHYNYFRDYNPGVGRYVEADPIGIRGGINIYGYVFNNSLRLTDVKGLAGASGSWSNGNIVPGFEDQDQVCSAPAGVLNSSKCTKKCCQEHDRCYERNGCNASSWLGNIIGNDAGCQRCNSKAVDCIMNNIGKTKCEPPGCEPKSRL